jgi:hypothetical protein
MYLETKRFTLIIFYNCTFLNIKILIVLKMNVCITFLPLTYHNGWRDYINGIIIIVVEIMKISLSSFGLCCFFPLFVFNL